MLSKIYNMADLEEGISCLKRVITNSKIEHPSFDRKPDMETLDWIKDVENFSIERRKVK